MKSRLLIALLSAATTTPLIRAQKIQPLHAPTIGAIDFYGNQKVPIEKLRKALALNQDDPLPSSKTEVEARLNDVPGVVAASLTATCCENGKAILYVGIEEKGANHFEYHAEPDGTATLPDEIVTGYRRFLGEVAVAAQHGITAEDLTQGHSLMQDSDAREQQKNFIGFADKYAKELHTVIHESEDEQARAIAAYVIGYSPDKNKVLDDLFYALRDPDETVRSNAIRALGAISVKARLDPQSGIKIPPTWFIEMLNSVVWTDRNYAATALTTSTETRDPDTLAQIRDRALPSLIEMAKWKHLEHALPAYILLGRVAGIPETELQDAWKNGKLDEMIDRAVASIRKKR